MIFDATQMDRALFAREFDVCVIGSGPAGMTLAMSLAAGGLDVALMEGGGLDLTEESQDLYLGEVTGLDNFELDVSRLRFFGGSSNHWYGVCKPLEEIDFLPRPGLPLSGWPIGRADLDPFIPRADEILDLDTPLRADRPVAEGGGFREVFWRRSPPTRFATKYHDTIAATGNLALCLNANLVDLRLDDRRETVVGAVFRSFVAGDPGFTVSARRYCLCLGGLENPRMLLNFDSQLPGGIGNRTGLVGRYFQDHVAIDIADILFDTPLPAQISYAPTWDLQQSHDMLNMAIMITPREAGPSAMSRKIVRTVECATPFTQRMVEHFRHATLRCKAGGLTEFMVQHYPEDYPTGLVWAHAEQPVLYESRVALNGDRDTFGLARITLDWRLDDHYYQSVRAATLALGGLLAEQGVGRIRIRNWLLEDKPVLPRRAENVGDIAARHHMGTTRMSRDPALGVVDTDCRVHDLGNLYIGGSSVFPTAGYVNPTYTIVQLALRLADHILDETRV